MNTDRTKIFQNTHIASVLLWAVMLTGFVSCNREARLTGDGERTLDAELSFTVEEAVDDVVHTRTDVAQSEATSQTFMGMEVTTSVTDETAAQTRATVYNTVNLNGKRVYAYVFDPSTNKTVAGMQTLTISGNKLTVRGCRGCKILFYIGGFPPSVPIGTDITTLTANEYYTYDAMQCISGVITAVDSDLGTLSFKHVFTKIRVTMKTSDGTLVNAFRLSAVLGYYRAIVNLASREYSVPSPLATGSGPADTLTTHSFSVSNNTSSVAEAAWVNLIAPVTPRALKLIFRTGGDGATIDGARNYLTHNVNNILTLQPHTFLPGHRYSIDITVRPTSIGPYMNAGFKADMGWYQWDAYEPLDTGDSHTWSPGNSGIHPLSGSVSGQDLAVQSCKDCPSLTEAKMYVGAGVLADDGHSGPYQPSYTITHPATGVKTTYHTGVWLKKKQYIPGFAEGTAPQAESSNVTGRPATADIDKYFFLPLYGFRDMTNGFADSFKGDGSSGYYHLRTANSNAYSYLLILTSIGARVGPSLNWTSNNVCSNNIWSAD